MEELLKLIPVVAEERLKLIPAHRIATREGISCESEKILEQYKLSLNTLQCLAIDYYPAMTGSKNGDMGKENEKFGGEIKIVHYSSTIHQKYCAVI
jgi:hypothetical protein